MGWQSRWAVEDHSRRHKTSQDDVLSNMFESNFINLLMSLLLSISLSMSYLLILIDVSCWILVSLWFHFGRDMEVSDRSQVSGFLSGFFGFGRSRPPGRRSAPARAAATGIGKNIEKIIKYVLSKTYAKKHRQTANHMKSLDMFGWRLTILIQTCTIIQIIHI